ncbi:MAG: phage tail tape measure protein [Candidatus Rokuibacteriota bacterium]
MPVPNRAQILVRAVDETRGAFGSIRGSLRQLGSEAGRLRTVFAGLGVGLSAAGFARIIQGSIEAADHINKLSQKIGISVEALSTLRFAAELSDVSLESLQTGIKKLSQGITEASSGTGKAAEVFRALGVSVTTTGGAIVPTEQVLLQIAKVFAGLEDGAVKGALAVELFGRSGLDLIPFLNQGAAGIARLTAEAERLGLKLTTETARAAEQFNDNLTALKATSTSLGIALTGELLPELLNITNAMREAAREAGVLQALWVGLGGLGNALFNGTEIRRAKDEVARLTELVEDLRRKVTTGQAPIPFTPFDIKFNEKALATLKASLAQAEAELAAARKRLEALVAPPRPEVKVPTGKPTEELQRIACIVSGGEWVNGKCVKKGETGTSAARAAREQLALAKAETEGAIKLLRDANERALRDLDARLSDHTVSLREYYAERVRLDQGAVDAEIESLTSELSAVGQNAAERGRLETEIELLRRKRADAAIQAASDEKAAEEELNRTVADLRARLLEARAKPLEARRLQIEQELVQGEIPPAVLTILTQLEGAELARAEFEELQRQLADIEQQRHLKEQSVIAETETRLFGEFEQRSRLVEVYRETSAELDALLPRLRALAAAHPELPEIGRAVTEAETELTRLRATSDQTTLEVARAVKGGVADLFDDLIAGSKKASDAFEDFAQSVLSAIRRIIAENLAEALFGGLFKRGGGKGGGFDLLGFLGGFFGFASGGFVQGPGTSTSDSIPARLSAGEYVLNAAAVRRVGVDFLEVLNGLTLGPPVSRTPYLALAAGGPVPERGISFEPEQRARPMTLKLDIHPQALHRTLREWLEGELGRIAASR